EVWSCDTSPMGRNGHDRGARAQVPCPNRIRMPPAHRALHEGGPLRGGDGAVPPEGYRRECGTGESDRRIAAIQSCTMPSRRPTDHDVERRVGPPSCRRPGAPTSPRTPPTTPNPNAYAAS